MTSFVKDIKKCVVYEEDDFCTEQESSFLVPSKERLICLSSLTSIVYLAITMGAHVSIVPNYQVGRVANLTTCGDAMEGKFGYELDLAMFTEDEIFKSYLEA